MKMIYLAIAVHVHPLEDGGSAHLRGLVGLAALGPGHPVDGAHDLRHLRQVDPPVAVHVVHAAKGGGELRWTQLKIVIEAKNILHTK